MRDKKPVTAAERQRQRRERLSNDGFKQVLLWVHTDDMDRVKEFQSTLVKPDAYDRDTAQSP